MTMFTQFGLKIRPEYKLDKNLYTDEWNFILQRFNLQHVIHVVAITPIANMVQRLQPVFATRVPEEILTPAVVSKTNQIALWNRAEKMPIVVLDLMPSNVCVHRDTQEILTFSAMVSSSGVVWRIM